MSRPPAGCRRLERMSRRQKARGGRNLRHKIGLIPYCQRQRQRGERAAESGQGIVSQGSCQKEQPVRLPAVDRLLSLLPVVPAAEGVWFRSTAVEIIPSRELAAEIVIRGCVKIGLIDRRNRGLVERQLSYRRGLRHVVPSMKLRTKVVVGCDRARHHCGQVIRGIGGVLDLPVCGLWSIVFRLFPLLLLLLNPLSRLHPIGKRGRGRLTGPVGLSWYAGGCRASLRRHGSRLSRSEPRRKRDRISSMNRCAEQAANHHQISQSVLSSHFDLAGETPFPVRRIVTMLPSS